MRHQMEEILKEELRRLAIITRDELHLTQREMAERLEMSESSYSDIETGRTMCGTLTTTLLLGKLGNPDAVLKQINEKLHQQY
ncbi:MAG: helix-turn-helix domain-containing protein [Clostridia bacterium]|nr:helix-turn-helix domain-containing protein [Clostridia bacterium]